MIPQDKGPLYISLFDIALNPTIPNKDGSEFFGSPTKLFEYMALSKAILSSDIGQMRSVLEMNKTALLYNPNDEKRFYQLFLSLLKDDVLRSKLGSNARGKVLADHTWDKNFQDIIDRLGI